MSLRRPTPKGKIGLRLFSDNAPLRSLAAETGLAPSVIHDKGEPVRLANGNFLKSNASQNYIAFADTDLDSSGDANLRLRDILDALKKTELSRLIASGEVEACIVTAAFHGDIDWQGEFDPRLVEAARAANIAMEIAHYDKFTDEGAPLAVRL